VSHGVSIILLPVGTQVVTRVDVGQPGGETDLPRGAVGVVVVAPTDAEHSYRVRFPDGREVALRRTEIDSVPPCVGDRLAGPRNGGR
jgi:hypothetical protein